MAVVIIDEVERDESEVTGGTRGDAGLCGVDVSRSDGVFPPSMVDKALAMRIRAG
jgi:hypothetical protein